MQPVRREKVTTKLRSGRRTKETPNHRCFSCDHREEIAAATPERGRVWLYYQRKPFYGCSYLTRMARKTA